MADINVQQSPDLWEKVLQRLPEALALTLRNSVAVDFLLDGGIEVTANNQFVVGRLSEAYALLQKRLQEVWGGEIPLKLTLDKNLKIHEPEPEELGGKFVTQPLYDGDQPSYYRNPNPHWTFETFHHGPYNRVAYFTAQRFANWDPECPPVFLLAASGSGKSHLAHAIWQEAMKRRSHAKAVYVHAKAFMKHKQRVAFGDGPKAEGERRRFEKLYHEADLFILDDVHRFFEEKNDWVKSIDELRDILDDLKERGALVMVISVLPVDSLKKCEEELRSRLRGMMVIKLDPPDYQARAAILKRLVQERGLAFPAGREEESAMAILERLPYDMRKLTQSAVPTLENYVKAMGAIEVGEEAIAACFGEQRTNPRLNVGIIQEIVAKRFKITVRDLKLKRVECPYPWTIVVHLCQTMLGASIQDIAMTLEVDAAVVNAALKNIGKQDEDFFTGLGSIREELVSL